MARTPVTVLTGWNRLKHLSTNTKEGFTEKNYYSTAEPACPRPSTYYHKKLPTSMSRMQYYRTIPTSELCHSDRMPTNQLHQKPDEALQTYNMRYASFFNLAYPELELDNPLSRMHCIHYASSLYGELGDEMTGRFNQDLLENLQTAFEKATNFEPRIIT